MLSLQSHALPVKQNDCLPIPSVPVNRQLRKRRAARIPTLMAALCPLCDRPSRRFVFVQTLHRVVVYNRCPHCRNKFHRRTATPGKWLARLSLQTGSALGSAFVVYVLTCLLLIGGQP